jgi:hypothetical protein
MLILALTPDDLARKTYRQILTEAGIESDGELKIGSMSCNHHGVMECDYEEGIQLSLPEGTIYILDLVTYGYGEKIEWQDMELKKSEFTEWGRGVCERYNCTMKIFVSANYW